jgi:hypothetical protein
MLAISTMRHDSLKGLSLRRICRIGPARYGLELPKREFSYRGVLCASEASRDRSGGGLRASGRGRATKLPLQPDLYQLVTDRDRAKAAPDGWENQRGLREDAGQVRGGEKDPFPIFGTLCVKRGLVRISRKDNKSIILHLERCTQRPESRRPQPGGSQYPDNPFMRPSPSIAPSRRARVRRRIDRL